MEFDGAAVGDHGPNQMELALPPQCRTPWPLPAWRTPSEPGCPHTAAGTVKTVACVGQYLDEEVPA
jgi:hypothetical protein